MKLDVSGKLQFSNYASIARVGVGTSEKLGACMGGGTIHDNKELVERGEDNFCLFETGGPYCGEAFNQNCGGTFNQNLGIFCGSTDLQDLGTFCVDFRQFCENLSNFLEIL